MKAKRRVGVIFGGRSGEHAVSLASARSVMAAIDRDKYEVVPIGITQEGRWLTAGDPLATLLAETAPDAPAAGEAVRQTSLARGRDNNSGGHELVPGATGGRFPMLDVIFPVLHGPFGEDGTIQGLFEMAGTPYVGSGVLASSLAMDKLAARAAFAAHSLPQIAYQGLTRRAWEADPVTIMTELEAALGFPMFVKPANLGSSIGISKARDRAQLAAALDEAARYDRRLLVERAVPHAREIECSVLGNDAPIASVPGEIVPCNEFYDFAAKYVDGRSQLLIPAPIPRETTERVQQLALAAFRAVDAAGLARVDFLLNGVTGELFLGEVNTMPGFTAISMYPKLWEASGISYEELVDRLIELALERHADRTRSLTTYGGPELKV